VAGHPPPGHLLSNRRPIEAAALHVYRWMVYMFPAARRRLPHGLPRRSTWSILGVAATLAALSQPSSAIIISASQGNGDGSFGITTASEYSGVVAVLNRKRDGNLATEASAVMIDPRHALTCAHPLVGAEKSTDPHDVFVNVEGVIHTVTAVTPHPEYQPREQYADLAVLTLALPVPPRVRSYPYNEGSLEELKIGKCTLVGLGMSGSAEHGFNPEVPPGVKRVATNTVDFISDGRNGLQRPDGSLLRVAPHSIVVDFDNHRTPEINGHPGEAAGHPHVPGKGTSDPTEGITCPGDSGGPLFQIDPKDGRRVIVGIASSGGGPFHGGIGDHSVFIQVAPFSRWISDVVRAN
jgi:secreted trypsin-like serine protease